MEHKFITSVIIVLLVGLGLGYGLGYVIYQPQILSLKSKLDEGQAQITNLNSTLQTILDNQSVVTHFEKLQFISAYADGVLTNYTITMMLRNTGTATATLDTTTVFLNGVPIGSAGATANFVPTQLVPGASTTLAIIALTGAQYTSGMSVEVMIQTASGSQYPKVVVLP